MYSQGKTVLLFVAVLILSSKTANSQVSNELGFNTKSGLTVENISLTDSTTLTLPAKRAYFSFHINNKNHSSSEVNVTTTDSLFEQIYENSVKVSTFEFRNYNHGLKGEVIFENISNDTLSISNVVPFGEDAASVYITGKGPWDLARAWLFRPGFRPVRVILPDNAWELGYCSFSLSNDISVCAIARRTKTDGGQRQRYETLLPPKAKVTYTLYAETFKGEWQNGLKLMFRDRYLHDIDKFDNTLFEREDLKWIKSSYLIVLGMAWDREFYDRTTGKYTFPDIIKNGNELFGKIDVFGIWPTWPRLGLDKRNQWDLYRNLPGGTEQLRNFARMSRLSGTRFFIAYNPWDNSTRKEDHLKGMANLISEIEADGVVLDTKGASSFELQKAADSVRKGVIMYSEGMAVTKDMPGIISGRVHNAIFLSPELNLNKLIKPDFSIFRVCDVGEDLIHRELAISFFNGYGTELNMFRPGGRDDNYQNDMAYLAKTTFILRQNNDVFLDNDWTPLLETNVDNIYVNRWRSEGKTLFTILNMKSEGYRGKLIGIEKIKDTHFVSLWDHEEIKPISDKGKLYLPGNTTGWDASYSGTRKEGSVDCIAEFPELLKSSLNGDSLKISKTGNYRIIIWQGNPSYKTTYREFRIINDTTIRVRDIFGYYEGKIVLQLTGNKILKDENILQLKGGKPWLVSRIKPTTSISIVPEDMVLIPGTNFSYNVTSSDNFIPYPEVNGKDVKIDTFLIDRYPVTNAQFYDFIKNTGYRPADTTRYLRLWQSGIYRQGQEKYPVVYVSLEEMNAYAKWAGKRLPSEAEWQLAAQGTDKRKWPWGDEFHGTNCNNSFDRPTPVDAFSKGKSPYGVLDIVGNVWQMTGDMYFNGSNYFSVIRGGSYYKPESSWWYIQGGPQSLDKTQILLLVSPGFDRSETVGFRCVKDFRSKKLKGKN